MLDTKELLAFLSELPAGVTGHYDATHINERIHAWRPGLKAFLLPDYVGSLDEAFRLLYSVCPPDVLWELRPTFPEPGVLAAEAVVKHAEHSQQSGAQALSPGLALVMATVGFLDANGLL